MSARPLASGTISFGLVSIRVKLYTATSPSAGLSFNLLHKKCGGRVKQQYICPKDEEIVPRDEMVKGYEFAKDQYVTFSPEELKDLEEKSTQSIEISEFLPIDQVDPVYFDKPYYLGPDRGGEKPYHLLSKVMKETGRAALAKYAARGKGYLVLIRPFEDGLVMQQLLYSDEVRSFADVPVERSEVKQGELELATRLVEQISTDEFHPEKYQDEVRKRTLDLIEKKVQGEHVSFAAPAPEQGEVVDLLEALKASLAKQAGGDARKPAKRAGRSGSEQGKGKASKG